jgi:hypothetical protein
LNEVPETGQPETLRGKGNREGSRMEVMSDDDDDDAFLYREKQHLIKVGEKYW